MTWKEVDALSREEVVLIPTGSLEQHGPHLPLFTDSLLATAVATAVEAKISSRILLTPTVWLGASGHHLAFAGSLSASFEGYEHAVFGIANSLILHGFRKIYLLNGHGGNTESNGIICRKLKAEIPSGLYGHAGYFDFIDPSILLSMKGPIKGIRHACEAETSLMMHLHPELVRTDKLRDDGLEPTKPIPGMVYHFDELTEEGSMGYATLAQPELGQKLFESAVNGVVEAMNALADNPLFLGQEN